MPSLSIGFKSDSGQLNADIAVTSVNLQAMTAELKKTAKQMRDTAAPAQELKNSLTTSAEAVAALQAKLAGLRSQRDALTSNADAASKVSATIKNLRAELQQVSSPTNEASSAFEHQSQIVREKLILAHEAFMGNGKRMVGSMMVLTERTGSLEGAFATLITPTTAAAAAVVILVGAFAKAAAIAEQWQESFGEIKAAMDATGAGFGTTNAQIGTTIDALRQLHGVNTETATDMVEMFSRQRDIGVNSYGALGEAAAGYARVTGSDVKQASQELVTALNGGYDSISKLDQQFPFLSTAQAQAIHDFDESGQKAKAYAVAITALQAKFGPLVNDGLTPLQTGANDLKDAWQGMTRAIGESSWLTSFNEQLGHVLSGLGIMIDYLHGAKTAASGFQPNIAAPTVGTPVAVNDNADQLRVLREIQDENLKLKADDADRGRIKQELARDEEALKTATGGEASIIQDNIALLQRQQRELNNRVGSGQMQDLRDQLEQELSQKRLVGDQEKQFDLQYWQEHLSQVQAGSKAEIEIRKQIASDQHDLDTKALSDEWQNFSENMRLKIEASKSNVAEQIALAQQWVTKGQSLYGDDIKNYKAALDEKTKLLQQQSADARKIQEIALQNVAAIDKIDMAGAPAPKGKDNSIIESLFGDVDGSAAKADLDRHMDALKAEFVAKQAEFNNVINGSDSTPVQIAEAQAKLAQAQEQYAVDTLNLNKTASQQMTQTWENAFQPIEHAFDSSIEGMLRGTQTLQAGMQKLAQSIVLSFIQNGIKKAFSSLSSELAGLMGGHSMGASGAAVPGVGSVLGMGQGAMGATSQTAQTTALTANTTALTSLTASLTGHSAVTTMNTTAQTAGTAATTTNTASQTSNVVSNTVQTTANTAAVASNTAALSTEAATGGGGGGGGGLGSILGMVGMMAMFDSGTDSVPKDMIAQIHKGEIIVPAAQSADLRSGKSMLGYGGGQSMNLPRNAADNMRFANSNDAQGNTINSKTSGDTNFHYAPTINAKSNVDLNSVLTQQGSTMRRWLTNQARNGSFKN